MTDRANRVLVLVAGVAAAAALAAEWMRRPGWILAAGVVLAGAVAAATAWSEAGRRLPRLLAWSGPVAALLLGASQLLATRRLERLQHHWPSERERLVTGASRMLGSELDAAVTQARGLAERAAAAQELAPPAAFERLAQLDLGEGPSHGVVLFDAPGRARAWAGIQRAHLAPAGPELSAVTTPFYLWLVARRQTSGGTAAAAVLLARSDDVPRAGDALTDRFAERTGVGLRFLAPGSAPADADVFDYVQPGPGGGDTLFAVQPVPPAQDVAIAVRTRAARRLAVALLLVMLGGSLAIALRTGLPALLLAAGASSGVIARVPWRATFPDSDWLWSASYAQRLLGPFSATAGALLLAGVVAFIVAGALWRRGIAPSWPGRVLAVAGTLLAPYALQRLARGIAPPLSGVAMGQWITWQVALVVSASALVLLAAALVRGPVVPAHAGRGPFIACTMAISAALLGLWLWKPVGAWPEWYPYLWAPALLLALRPMPSRATLVTIAVVAGSSAALLTWGAVIEGRMALARRDVDGLGAQVEPVTLAQLDSTVHQVPRDFAPRGAGDLFLLWRRSLFGAASHPASLGVWSRAGTRDIGLDLAELDVPADLVRQVAREADSLRLAIVRPAVRGPGLHGIGAVPLRDGRVLTLTVGPRSLLVAPSRVARFLLGAAADPEPPYDVALAPPAQLGATTPGVVWRRAGWTVLGERSVLLPDGTRHAHARIDLRGAAPVLQRGLLLLVLDVAVLALLWLFLELAAGRALPALQRWWPRARRSLRLRLAVSLALFFVVPTTAIALWSLGRLEDEFRGARELLLQRTLRDAVGGLALDTSLQVQWLSQAARRVDAELLLAEDGAMTTSSAPVLADLGLVDLQVPGEVYRRLVWEDEVETSVDQRATPTPTLVGYRLLSRTDGGHSVILGAPELLSDRALRRREADLGLAVMVAAVAGVLAALVLAGLAARALAEPLQQLRRAALAVGAGEQPMLAPGSVPLELEPIGGALAQAAAQVEAGQRAQRVLAWGEMARQVAHEIKNPLTPIRLGVQHLLRLFAERPAELETSLPRTGERILAEIDRLDGIARAFSRFALPGAEGVPLEVVDLGSVVRDVVQLYRVGEGPTQWEAEASEDGRALARRDELVEVLLNLCENARVAGATRVVISARADGAGMVVEVRDNGHGIAPEVLPRVFEPRFSTNTSGSGLGLAIAKRLVESWGGTITVTPQDVGTTVRLTLRAPA